ncbi:MAG TPA: AI-2E family transporter [Rectinemataceae bacterium]|nr:AI-2E family transporter [Rectinemataceae bacterium]
MTQGSTKKQIFLIFFIALFLLVARLFYPFLTVILWSGVIYAFIAPLYERCAKVFTKRDKLSDKKRSIVENILGGIFAVLGVFVLAVPFTFLFIALLKQVVDLSGNMIRVIEEHPDIFSLSHTSPVGGFIYRLSAGAIDLSGIDVLHEAKGFLIASSSRIIGFSGTILKNGVALITTLAFMIFTLYFLLVDGKHLASLVVSAVPIERTYTKMFMQKMSESGRQLVLGFFLVAIYQAVVMFILCLIFKLEGPLVLASLTAIASFIPMVGTSLVWIPLSLYIGLTGDVGRALLFCALAGFFVSFTDNFLRPMILGDRLKMHPLLIFFAIVGGLSIFGFNGLILGPLIVIIFFSAVELYDQIDQVKAANPGSDEQSSS